jgi:protein-disulfide isomerase-like protein with CxxC motif
MDRPILLAFLMRSCPYCKPLLERGTPLSELQNLVEVRHADSERDAQLARDLNVNSYPTLFLIFPDDRAARYEGERTLPHLQHWIKQAQTNRLESV